MDARLRGASRVAGTVALGVGVAVLLSWLLGVSPYRALFPARVSMVPSAALGAVLLGASLWLLGKDRRGVAQACASLAVLIGALRIVDAWSGGGVPIDAGWTRLLHALGREASTLALSPVAAVGLVLVGTGLLGATFERTRAWSQWLGMAAAMLGALALSRYPFGSDALLVYLRMSVPTAGVLLVMGLGLICAVPEGPVARLMTSDDLGGFAARRLLPAAAITPLVIGALAYHRSSFGIASSGDVLWLIAVLNVLLLGIIVFVTVEWLRRADDERGRAHAQVEASLREVTNLRAMLDEHAIMSVTDNSGAIVFANDKFCEISGYARSELIGRDHRVVNSGVHSQEFFDDLWRTIRGGTVWHGEVCNRRRDGALYWEQTTIVPFQDDRGEPLQYVAICADITERKRVEQNLAASEEHLRIAARVGGVGTFEYDHATRRIYVSSLLREMAGLGDDGRNPLGVFLKVMHDEDRDPTMEALVRSFDPTSHIPGPTCRMGEFVPYTKPK